MGDVVELRKPLDPDQRVLIERLKDRIGKDAAIGFFGDDNGEIETRVVDVNEDFVTVKIRSHELASIHVCKHHHEP